MSTNLESTYHLCQIAHPLLKGSGAGSIVFISSVAGLVCIGSGTIYAASKGEPISPLHCGILHYMKGKANATFYLVFFFSCD